MNEEILTFTEETADEPVAEETLPLEDAPAEELVETEVTVAEEESAEPEEDVEAMKSELAELRRELTEKRNAFERMSREIEEFSELFPDKALSSVPDSVWESVRSGIPLAASFALYEKKTAAVRADAERVNSKNSSASTGPIGRNSSETFFTPDEVRAMSREEVKSNYSKILESMKKWN